MFLSFSPLHWLSHMVGPAFLVMLDGVFLTPIFDFLLYTVDFIPDMWESFRLLNRDVGGYNVSKSI